VTQTSLKHLNVTHVTTDTSTASAFLTGFALISRVAYGAGSEPLASYAPGIHSLSIGL